MGTQLARGRRPYTDASRNREGTSAADAAAARRAAARCQFKTHSGTVFASNHWGAEGHRKRVNPAMPDSYELLFHEVGLPRFVLTLPLPASAGASAAEGEFERAIGVVYRPDTERHSHYFGVSWRSRWTR